MFLLINKENSICGIMGLLKHQNSINSLEIDNVIKFENCKDKSIFSKVLQELLIFSKKFYLLKMFSLK